MPKFSTYGAASAPDTGDKFIIFSGADSDTALMTKAQLFDLSGEGTLQVILPLSNDATTPTLAFGDGNDGIYNSSNNNLAIALGGGLTWNIGQSFLGGAAAGAGGIAQEVSSATNPTLVPYNADTSSGVGGISGEVSIITGGVEAVNVDAAQVVSLTEKLVLPITKFIEFGTSSIAGITGSHGAGGYLKLYTNGSNKVEISPEGTVKIAEAAAAVADTAGFGQLWVKNTTPCQLWFTDDAGTDTQIV